MDFLKHIAFPQSLEHIALVHLTLNFVQVLFIPYVSVLFGASIVARYFEHTGKKSDLPDRTRFARELTMAVIPNKSSLFLFGLLPFLSLFLAYAQLLQTTDSVAVSMLFIAFLLFTVAAGLLFTYRYTFTMHGILTLAVSAGQSQDLEAYADENDRLHDRAGAWGIGLLSVSLLLLMCGMAAASTPSETTTLGDALLSLESIARIGQFLAASGMLTGAAILFLFFSGKDVDESEYSQFVRKFSITLSLISTLVAPVFMLSLLAALPRTALTGSVFGISAIILILLFAAGHFFYAMMKKFSPRLAGNALFILLAVLILSVIKDQNAFGSATRQEAAVLASHYDKEQEAMLAALGIGAKALTGEEIFTGRCSACHMFDQKKVGPAYKDVLPKYESKRDELTAFILNPRKMNPAFPPMPNQGLRPAEADSIAAYIMHNYKGK